MAAGQPTRDIEGGYVGDLPRTVDDRRELGEKPETLNSELAEGL
jgi:hypothetical protein